MKMELTKNPLFIPDLELPPEVKIVEVGPRDGLQNESTTVPVKTKVAFIDRLSKCGFSTIEVGSLVSAEKVPQMARSIEVFQTIEQNESTRYPLLVANRKGLNQAIQSKVRDVAVFCAASETFSQRNNNCSIDENLNRLEAICDVARRNGIWIRGYVSCVLGCPYEGKIDQKLVAHFASRLYALGCYEISLGDTIGVGTPGHVKRLIETVASEIPLENLAVHFHDSYGQALANTYAALQAGIRVVDSSIAGLGGCPFAPGATGNLATEDLVYMLNGLGVETGIDLKALISAGWFISRVFQRKPVSKVSRIFEPEYSCEPAV